MGKGLRSRRLAVMLVAAVIGGGALLAVGAAASVKPGDCEQKTSGGVGERLCFVGPRVVSVNTSEKYILSVQNTGSKTIKQLVLQLHPSASLTVKRASMRYTKLAGNWDTWTYRNVQPGVTHHVTLTLAFGPRQPGMSHWSIEDQTRMSTNSRTFLYQGVPFAPKRK